MKGYRTDQDEVRRKLASNGLFQIARAAAAWWRGKDSWTDAKELEKQIGVVEAQPAVLDPYLEKALKLLEEVARGKPDYLDNLDAALKSSAFDIEITKRLHAAGVK